jgi:hypothetical protein
MPGIIGHAFVITFIVCFVIRLIATHLVGTWRHERRHAKQPPPLPLRVLGKVWDLREQRHAIRLRDSTPYFTCRSDVYELR